MEFIEGGVKIIYSPALDVIGYGTTDEEARSSFETALTEFIIYTSRKKTFQQVLSVLGWKVKGSRTRPKFEPPLNTELVDKNPFYSEILNHKNFRAFAEDVEIAIT